MTDTNNIKTVLVVDDEEDVAKFLKMILEDAGFKVITASNGEEAIEEVKSQVPDFISLDLVMPKKSGIRFYYELRRNPKWSKIPVVVVSGHAQDEQVRKDINDTFAGKTISGPSIYLEKPVKPRDFVNMVKKTLGMKEDENTNGHENDMRDKAKEMINDIDSEKLKEVLKFLKK